MFFPTEASTVSNLCLQCPADAKSFAARRGLCIRCYRRCAHAVNRGQTTWAQLESKGQALPAQPQGVGWRKGFRMQSENGARGSSE
jgi:hypothetical protein